MKGLYHAYGPPDRPLHQVRQVSSRTEAYRRLGRAKPRTRTTRLLDGLKNLYAPLSRSWPTQAYDAGRIRKPSPQLSLVRAREKASLALLQIQTGKGPAELQPKRLSSGPPKDSFRKLAEMRINKLRRKGRSESYIRNMTYGFERHVFRKIGDKSIRTITKADILSVLSKLEEKGQTTSYNRILTQIRPVFALAEVPDPSARIEKYPEKNSEAWFTLKEIAKICIALDAKETQAHPMTSLAIKLGILSLKRAREVAEAQFNEFDGDIWRIPAERMKGRRLEVVPYTSLMRAIVDAARAHPRRPEITEDSPFVFPSTHVQDAPIESTAMSRAFPRARRASGLTAHKGTLHSMRHSGTTILASNRSSPYIVSALLSHQLAASGVAKVTSRYNMYDLLDERRDALETWNAMVMQAVADLRKSLGDVLLAEDPIEEHIRHGRLVDGSHQKQQTTFSTAP